jgi:hypothetical protein
VRIIDASPALEQVQAQIAEVIHDFLGRVDG